jgi:putative heme-binding domain-containing protein
MYEGTLLPSQFQNQLIHAEPGKNVVRSYPVEKSGAGYTAEIINILSGENDKWFRPADVCVAPDGSLIIADWYDPGVGGHQAGDQQKGRIYRVAPKGSKYQIPKQDYSNPEGAILALKNPNLAVRYLAWQALTSFGKEAIPALEKMWNSDKNPRMRARAFWMLVKNVDADKYIDQAIKEKNPDLRMMGIRAARQSSTNLIRVIEQLVDDKDPQVRRECAIALHHNPSPEMPMLWAKLAIQHDGEDRWFLEALGIGAADQWDKCFLEYNKLVHDPLNTQAGKDIVWRARTDKALPYLAQLASDSTEGIKSRLRYFRAFDFNTGSAKDNYLLAMVEANDTGDLELNKLILNHLNSQALKESKAAKNALTNVLRSVSGSEEYLTLVRRYGLNSENQHLLNLVISGENGSLSRNAAALLLDLKGGDLLRKSINNSDTVQAVKVINALGGIGSKQSLDILQNIAFSAAYDKNIRLKAATKFGASMGGEDRVLDLLQEKKISEELIPYFVDGLKGAWRKEVYFKATAYLPEGAKVVEKKEVPKLEELSAMNNDVVKGKAVFQAHCFICHQVNNEGFEFGPSLTEIGTKLPKEAILEAIVSPSAGISFGYETWELLMKDESIYTGIIANKTETDIDLLYPAGVKYAIKTSDVKSMKQLPASMMPTNMHENMSKQELANLLAYLSGLKSVN